MTFCHLSSNLSFLSIALCTLPWYKGNKGSRRRCCSAHIVSSFTEAQQEASTPMMSPPLSPSMAEAARDHREKKLQDDPAAIISEMPLSRTPSFLQRDAESGEEIFSKALLELKDLRSQLHYAADYCENAFLENKERRRMILDSTKSYICEAIVAVVDHLGNVSSKLEERILDNSEIVVTEQKMDCLKQRLLTCQQYAVSIEVSSLRWSISFPRHHHHYASPCSWARLMIWTRLNLRKRKLSWCWQFIIFLSLMMLLVLCQLILQPNLIKCLLKLSLLLGTHLYS